MALCLNSATETYTLAGSPVNKLLPPRMIQQKVTFACHVRTALSKPLPPQATDRYRSVI